MEVREELTNPDFFDDTGGVGCHTPLRNSLALIILLTQALVAQILHT